MKPILLFLFLGFLPGVSAASVFGDAGAGTVLVDASGSMGEPLSGSDSSKIEAVARALENLGRELEREASGGPALRVLGFTTKIELQSTLQPGSGAGATMARFTQQLRHVVAENRGTALYAALAAALEDGAEGGCIHVISDGIDTSQAGPGALEAALRVAARRGVKVYFLGLGKDVLNGLRADLEKVGGDLAGLVATTGETRDLAAALLPPRLIVVERDGMLDAVAVGAGTVGARLTWSLNGQRLDEETEHVRFAVQPGEHELEVRATLPGNRILGSRRTFLVRPPEPPKATIVPLIPGNSYTAGKRASFRLVPAPSKSEWRVVGGSIRDAADERVNVILGEGSNVIRVRATWPNGSTSEVETTVKADASLERLILEASPAIAIIGAPTKVRAVLGGRPVAAEIRLGTLRSSTGELEFCPEEERDYTLTAAFEDDGLVHEAETILAAVYPPFSAELTGPTELDHGQEGIFTVLVSGEELRELRWQPQDLMQAEGERVARLRAQNETGEVVTLNLGVELVTATGRRFSRTKDVRVNPRPGRPVAALLVPGDVVRVGDAITVSCRSSGLIKRRLLAVDGGPALPLDEVKEVLWDRDGEHTLMLEVEGPGGRDLCEVKVNVLPALVPPFVVEVSGLPARVYSKDVLRLAATVRGDARELRLRANGRLIGAAIGSTTELAWTPDSAGRVLLEVEALPASSAHAPASKQITVEVTHHWRKIIYEHSRHAAGAGLALMGLLALWVLTKRGPRLRGTLTVGDSQRSVVLKLSGKEFDLTAAMRAHGWDLGAPKARITVLPGGELAMVRAGESEVLLEAHKVQLTDLISITWACEA